MKFEDIFIYTSVTAQFIINHMMLYTKGLKPDMQIRRV
jgi:hypothetical protein